VSRHHQLIKNDPRWKEAKRLCHERDGWACVECDETDQLEADHIVRLAEAPELAFDLDNLQTLCESCHDQKEREYQARQLERVEWISDAYPELKELRKNESEESVTLFL